jgi:hypothetical protein
MIWTINAQESILLHAEREGSATALNWLLLRCHQAAGVAAGSGREPRAAGSRRSKGNAAYIGSHRCPGAIPGGQVSCHKGLFAGIPVAAEQHLFCSESASPAAGSCDPSHEPLHGHLQRFGIEGCEAVLPGLRALAAASAAAGVRRIEVCRENHMQCFRKHDLHNWGSPAADGTACIWTRG